MNRKGLKLYLAFALIISFALFLRLYNLDERVFHHDEAAVGYFTYKLFNDGVYSYDPSFHGPFMYYITAEIYRRIGDSEFSSRLLPAIFGASMLFLLVPLRKYLGNTGMLLAAFFFTFSASFLYYSRFYREDIFISFFTLLMLVCAVKYAERLPAEDYISIRPLYLFLGLGVLASIAVLWVKLPSLSILMPDAPRLLAFITIALIVLFAILLMKARYSILRFLYLFLAAASLASMAALKENAYIAMALIVLFLLLLFIREKKYKGLIEKLKLHDPGTLYILGEGLFFILVVLVIFSLFYTGKLLDLYGVKTAVERAVSHWYEMHRIERIGGAYFFYLPIIALYELPVLVFGVLGIAHYCCNRKKDKILMMLLVYWVAADVLYLIADRYPALKDYLPTSYLPSSIVILFPLLVLGIIIVLYSKNLFFAFLGYWALANFFIYSYVQEKVPWLVLNPLLPLVIIAAAYLGELLPRLKINSKAGAAAVIFLSMSLSYFVYSSVLLNYYNYTDPAEPLIQASQPPQKYSLFLDKVKEISSQYQNQSTPIQLTDANMETQFLWYMRHYSKVQWKVRLDAELNAPLIVVHEGDGNNTEADVVQRDLSSDYKRLDSAKMSWYWFKASDVTPEYLLFRKMDREASEYRFALFYKPKK